MVAGNMLSSLSQTMHHQCHCIAANKRTIFHGTMGLQWHIRPAALPKPIIISVPRPHCWKGLTSKPDVLGIGGSSFEEVSCCLILQQKAVNDIVEPTKDLLWEGEETGA
ncbi:hypothetical protein VNO78_20338 [Psophocarpus tetragonolobus]|uniref:Uncharacterized protein n=1 Tax=Psophocarpus tetragonolobus TaxID=3891 RepID=A0AAN9XH11_PSOTE